LEGVDEQLVADVVVLQPVHGVADYERHGVVDLNTSLRGYYLVMESLT
jgi:hypothetical protein